MDKTAKSGPHTNPKPERDTSTRKNFPSQGASLEGQISPNPMLDSVVNVVVVVCCCCRRRHRIHVMECMCIVVVVVVFVVSVECIWIPHKKLPNGYEVSCKTKTSIPREKEKEERVCVCV